MPSAKMIGNRAATFIRGAGSNGVGALGKFNAMISHVALVGKSGDINFLTAGDITMHVDQGYFFQTTGGAIISFTLQGPEIACNPDPDVQASVAWVEPLTLAAGTIEERQKGFACIKVELTADGEVYLMSR